MRVAARDVVRLADRQDLVDRPGHGRMLVLARKPEILRQITFADDDDADAGHLFEHFRQVADRPHLLAHDRDQHLALRVQRPDIGALVIFLLRQPPIARRGGGSVAALAGGLVIGRRARARIAAGGYCVQRLLDRADMRPDDAVDAMVEHLLGNPLAGLAAIGRNAHERRHRR